jgi:hypothetical protein
VDDTAGHFGIATYNITLAGATAIDNRSPVTSILDASGDPQPAGFSMLRTGANANPIQASIPLPGTSPFIVKGIGRDASDFVTQAAAIQPGSTVIGPSTSPAWGNYDTISPNNGKNWLFIAEGTYGSGMPLNVTQASFNIFTSPTTFSNILVSQFTLLVIPEPTAISLIGMALVGLSGFTRRRPLQRPDIIRIDSPACSKHHVEQLASMFAARIAPRVGTFLASFLLAAVLVGSTSQASVIVGLILNPGSTAGGGATSTRSGNGSWQMYAIESTDSTDFGISSYNITMSGTTAINHRSPNTTVLDNNGDVWAAGFSLLRSGTNVNPIVASQALPGTTPFLITGFGQTASDFVTKSTAIDASAVVIGPTTSGAWGNYNSPVLSNPTLLASYGNPAAVAAVTAGKKWVFLAEGLGPAGVTQITSAVFTVFSNASGASSATTTSILGPACLDCQPFVTGKTFDNVNASDPGSVAYTFTGTTYFGPNTWGGFTYVSGPTPAVPATFDPATQKFNWNTVGSTTGSYKWSIQASNTYGPGTGYVIVNINIPEPATLSLVGIGMVGGVRLIRSRSRSQT